MFRLTEKLKRASVFYGDACRAVVKFSQQHSNSLMFLLGASLVCFAISEPALAQVGGKHGDAIAACNQLIGYMEGGFGALVAAAAGVGAIIAAAVGGFKAAWGLLVVSIGAFILRSYITLFNGGC